MPTKAGKNIEAVKAVTAKLGIVETAIGTTNTKLGTVEADIEATVTAVAAVTTKLGTIETDIETTNTKLGTLETDTETLMGSTSLIKRSTGGGTQKLTIPADPFQIAGSNQECRSILVVHSSDNAVYVNIGAVANADNFLIPKNIPIPIPVDNCSRLNFFGTAADVVRLLWRD